jgi:hypothetical protein
MASRAGKAVGDRLQLLLQLASHKLVDDAKHPALAGLEALAWFARLLEQAI